MSLPPLLWDIGKQNSPICGYSVCLENFRRKTECNSKITPDSPENESGLTQSMMIGESNLFQAAPTMVYLRYRVMSYTQPTMSLTTAGPCVKIRNWRKNVAVYVLELQQLHSQILKVLVQV